MAVNCEALQGILRDCSNALGGIAQRIYINSSDNVNYDGKTASSHIITGLDLETIGATSSPGFETIEFRKNLASLVEDYANDPDGAVLFDQTLVIPIHGRDASKSEKISIIASGQREVDIIIPQNGGGYVYLRQATLSSVGDGTGATKKEGSKYTLTFTAESEELALYIDEDILDDLIEPITP